MQSSPCCSVSQSTAGSLLKIPGQATFHLRVTVREREREILRLQHQEHLYWLVTSSRLRENRDCMDQLKEGSKIMENYAYETILVTWLLHKTVHLGDSRSQHRWCLRSCAVNVQRSDQHIVAQERLQLEYLFSLLVRISKIILSALSVRHFQVCVTTSFPSLRTPWCPRPPIWKWCSWTT